MIPTDISLLSVLIPLNKKYIAFPQFVVLSSYYVISTVYPILTSPGTRLSKSVPHSNAIRKERFSPNRFWVKKIIDLKVSCMFL